MENNTQFRKFSLWKISDVVLNISTVFLLGIILCMMILQIVMRYLFNNPLTWSEEVARYSLFWMAFLGSIIAVREQSHLYVDLVVHAFPEKLGKTVKVITYILILLFLGCLCIWGIQYCKMNMISKSLVTGVVKGKVYSVIPISAAWMAIYQIRNLIETIKGKGGIK